MGASTSNLSAPFYLLLYATNKTFDGTALEVCRTTGAGDSIALCALGATANDSTSMFQFKKISTAADETPAGTGFLQYFPTQGQDPLQLDLRYDPISTVAFAQFVGLNASAQGGLYTAFFDERFEISTNYIDEHPSSENFFHAYPYYRWLVCNDTIYSGTYTNHQPGPTLNWQLGHLGPTNPTCDLYDVKQQFVSS